MTNTTYAPSIAFITDKHKLVTSVLTPSLHPRLYFDIEIDVVVGTGTVYGIPCSVMLKITTF